MIETNKTRLIKYTSVNKYLHDTPGPSAAAATIAVIRVVIELVVTKKAIYFVRRPVF